MAKAKQTRLNRCGIVYVLSAGVCRATRSLQGYPGGDTMPGKLQPAVKPWRSLELTIRTNLAADNLVKLSPAAIPWAETSQGKIAASGQKPAPW